MWEKLNLSFAKEYYGDLKAIEIAAKIFDCSVEELEGICEEGDAPIEIWKAIEDEVDDEKSICIWSRLDPNPGPHSNTSEFLSVVPKKKLPELSDVRGGYYLDHRCEGVSWYYRKKA